MSQDLADVELYKRLAAERAVDFVRSGMVVGLGTGSTAIYATRRIAELLRQGALSNIVGVPTSRATAAEAERLGIRLASDDLPQPIDMTIDGADEVSPALDLVKGGGGALLREKIVAESSARRIYVVDDSKLSPQIGTHRTVPVEVVTFGWRRQFESLEHLGAKPTLRLQANATPFLTDQGNFIVDCAFGPIADPSALAESMRSRAGVVEHGLFIGLTSDLIVAGANGIDHRTR